MTKQNGKKDRQKSNWILDALIFIGFLVSFVLDLTGTALHQWIGVLGGVLIVYHLVLHWDWVAAVTRRIFSKTCTQARIYYLLDASILLALYLIVSTGLFISTWLELPIANYSAWKDFHEVVSLVSLGLITLKIAVHWRWIVCVARRSFARGAPRPSSLLHPAPVLKLAGMAPVIPVPASAGVSRREFLKLMGIVGAASLAAVAFTLDDRSNSLALQTGDQLEPQSPSQPQDQAGSQVAEAAAETVGPSPTLPETVPSEPPTNTALAFTSTPVPVYQSQVTAACIVRCDKHCAYPGQCRMYQDGNSNGLCDLGECL